MTLHPRRIRLKPRKVRRVYLMTRVVKIAPGLNKRELELLQWMANGKRHADIAEILSITVDAIRQHNFRIKNKLGANTMPACVAIALRKGLIQ